MLLYLEAEVKGLYREIEAGNISGSELFKLSNYRASGLLSCAKQVNDIVDYHKGKITVKNKILFAPSAGLIGSSCLT